MNGMLGPMMADNPYAAEVVAARQRIARLKDRLAQRAMARRRLTSETDDLPDTLPEETQARYPQTCKTEPASFRQRPSKQELSTSYVLPKPGQ
jgi:hypothetical protein